ncbi:MAG: PD-(D/E)XK nuclease family protein [Thermoleophilum sp.]|nr:PD-(D/E)XK nuclease family protein [Thermoleophilum sp.]
MMRTIWLAIRLYPESAAARRFVIVSALGFFLLAAGVAALVALLYRNSPVPQLVVPLLDQVVSMERPGTLLAAAGPVLLIAGAAIFWLTLSNFREAFLPDMDEAYRLLLLRLMAIQKERERAAIALIGAGPGWRGVAVALARTHLDVRGLWIAPQAPAAADILALARNATALRPLLEDPPPVAPTVALDEVYPLQVRLVRFDAALDAAALRRLLGEPAIIAAVNHVFRQLWSRERANGTGAGDSAQTQGGASDRADTAAPGGGADTAGSGGQADAAAHADAPPWLARHRDLVAASARSSGGATGGERTEPAVEIVAIIDDTDSRTSGGKRSKLAAATARVLEAELLAERIVELARVDAATDDRERVGGSKPRWGGWALLLRAGSDAAIYERALAARGVPVYNGAGRGFFAQLPVRDALAWLRVLANPHDEEALVEAALSPIGAVPVPTLVRAITAGTDPQEPAAESGEPRARRRGPMWLRLVEAARSLPGDEAGRAAVARFVEMVESERAALGERSLDELVERCLERTGYGAYLLSLPDGQRRVANVRKLALLARAYERVEGRDLRGLCDSLRDLQVSRDLREPEAVLESEGSDSLRILTIHQSKGLEFDNVVVADLDRQKSRTGSSRLRLRVTPQVAFVLEVPALNEMRAPGSKAGATRGPEWEALAAEIDAREQAETERLIYVAMTRARHRLLLAGRFSPGGERSGQARKESGKERPAAARGGATHPASLLARTRERAAQTVASWLFPALREGAVEVEGVSPAASEERTFAADGATTITGTLVSRVLAVRARPPPAHPAGGATDASDAAGGFLLAVNEFRPQLPDERASDGGQAARSGDGGDASRSGEGGHAPGRGEEEPPVGAAASGAPPARAVAASAPPAPPTARATSPPDPGARGAPLPGALAAPVWRRLSYTQLSQFERCAYRYYLERIVRLAPHPDDAVPAGRWTDRDPRAGMRRGRVVHALLERVDARRPDSLPKVEEIAAALVEARLGSGEAVLGDAVSIRRQLERLFAPENPLAARLAGARRVRSELPFVVAVPVERDRASSAQGELGDGAARPVVPITGVFDVYAEEWDDAVLVVDYKTDALAERGPRELFAASHYDLQQRVYALAALRAGAGRVEVAHVFLEAPESPVTQVFVAAHADSLEADLRERAERLAAGRFEPTEDPHFAICAACPGRSGLCKWPRELTGALRE